MFDVINKLKTMEKDGIKELEIYQTSGLNPKDTCYNTVIMQDELNQMCHMKYTWIVRDLLSITSEIKQQKIFICNDYTIITTVPFSDKIIREAINKWLLYHQIKIKVKTMNYYTMQEMLFEREEQREYDETHNCYGEKIC